MRVRRLVVIGSAHVFAGLLFLAPAYVRPDSVGVYAHLRSAVIDGDLLLFNEWAGFGMIRNGVTWFKEVTPLGTLADHWGIGASLMLAPAYLVARVLAPGGDGFSGLYAAVLAWGSVFMTALTMILGDSVSESLTGLGSRLRAIVLVASLLGTPLFWYTFRFPLVSHAAGALAVAVLVWLLIHSDALEQHAYLIGLALGLAASVRVQHLVLGAGVIAAAVLYRSSPRFYARAAGGLVLAAAPQALVWTIIYGSPLGPLTGGASLAGSTWTPFQATHFMAVLWSSYHGLFSWCPVTLLAVAGWLLALRTEHRRPAIVLTVMFAATWIANATLDRYFWTGLSFGLRRFTDLAIVFAMGLAWFVQWSGRYRSAALSAIAVTTAWTVGLAVAAMRGTLDLSRYVSGGELLRAFGSALQFPWNIELHSAAVDLTLFGHSFAAIAVLTLTALAIWQARRRAREIATIYLLACSLALGMLWRPTRERGESQLQRFGIDRVAASRWGPLTDQRRLLEHEMEFYRATGRPAKAAGTEQEIQQIDVILDHLRK